MTVAEILHEILTIAAGSGAAQWLHDEIDKLDAAQPAAEAPAAPATGFLAAPEATT